VRVGHTRASYLVAGAVSGYLLLTSSDARGSARRFVQIVDTKYGLHFAVPKGWTPYVHSAYEVGARGKDGGMETHVVIRSRPVRAVRDYFLIPGERGAVHFDGRWACATSRNWSANPGVDVVVCSSRLPNGHALVVSVLAHRWWLRRAGGETFLRSLVQAMRGFRADDD